MKLYRIRLGAFSVLVSSFAFYAHADVRVDQMLEEFDKDPWTFSTDPKNVKKYVEDFNQITQQWEESKEGLVQKFSDKDIEPLGKSEKGKIVHYGKFVDIKNAHFEPENKTFAIGEAAYDHKSKVSKAGIEPNDNPALLNGPLAVTNIDIILSQYRSKFLSESPWSSDYFPIYSGGIAKPYAMGFKASTNFRANEDEIERLMRSVSPNSSNINLASPAMKYDMIVGDTNFSLSQHELDEGRAYARSNGGLVETWMGKCHGWAPAAYAVARPSHTVKVRTYDGHSLDLFPSDIKALVTALWAKAAPRSNFVGTRCNIKNPSTDAYGRIENSDCNNNNPATVILALVNQIGVKNESMIVDATFDREVWNQPALGYKIVSLFNPQTNRTVDSLAAARVSLPFRGDKFARWREERKSGATSVVGLAVDFTYIAETAPTSARSDSSSMDRRVTVRYLADVELNSRGDLVGGEWYHQLHPDFMWHPRSKVAWSVGDQLIDHYRDRSVWNVSDKIPALWQKAAIQSSRKGQPLARILNVIVDAAKSHHSRAIGLEGITPEI